jgi:hypothetical protein
VRAIVARTSWDITANAMHKLIESTEPGNRAQRLSADAGTQADIADAGAKVSPLPLNTGHKQAAQAADLDAEPIKAQAAE